MLVRLHFSIVSVALLFAGMVGAQPQVDSNPGLINRTVANQIIITGPPKIGLIDFYGLNKVSSDRIRKTLGVKEGDPFPPSKANVEELIDALPGVVESHLEAICCNEGKMILYVGLEERGAPRFDIREVPENDVKLPEQILNEYRRYLEAFTSAAQSGLTAQDLTLGYALSADSSTRNIQQQFPDLAKAYIREIREVARNSFDDEQRTAAAFAAAYNPSKKDAVNDLQLALRDADPGVRGTAAAGLLALIVYARRTPDAEILIQPTWFIEMLNSLSWSDRSHALRALEILSDTRDPSLLNQIRDRALGALVDMSRWKTLEHALPAFVITGRIAGRTEEQIQDAWSRGDRESLIAAALKKKSR